MPPLLLAVSGGLDSMVLTDLCLKSGLNIALAHCNFKLRADESDGDEHFIKDFAKTHNLEVLQPLLKRKRLQKQANNPFKWLHVNCVMNGLIPYKYQNGFEYILTAHHADDNLETFLLIYHVVRELKDLKEFLKLMGQFVRPLLEFSREDIHNFATQSKNFMA